VDLTYETSALMASQLKLPEEVEVDQLVDCKSLLPDHEDQSVEFQSLRASLKSLTAATAS